jgi:hypothetical protein
MLGHFELIRIPPMAERQDVKRVLQKQGDFLFDGRGMREIVSEQKHKARTTA